MYHLGTPSQSVDKGDYFQTRKGWPFLIYVTRDRLSCIAREPFFPIQRYLQGLNISSRLLWEGNAFAPHVHHERTAPGQAKQTLIKTEMHWMCRSWSDTWIMQCLLHHSCDTLPLKSPRKIHLLQLVSHASNGQHEQWTGREQWCGT